MYLLKVIYFYVGFKDNCHIFVNKFDIEGNSLAY
jgi:hypothetical protein